MRNDAYKKFFIWKSNQIDFIYDYRRYKITLSMTVDFIKFLYLWLLTLSNDFIYDNQLYQITLSILRIFIYTLHVVLDFWNATTNAP